MSTTSTRASGELAICITDQPIDDATIAAVKSNVPGSVVYAGLLEPLYDTSIPTREAAHALGRLKMELESMVEKGTQVIVICQRRPEDLSTRSHFLASLCAAANRVHFLKST